MAESLTDDQRRLLMTVGDPVSHLDLDRSIVHRRTREAIDAALAEVDRLRVERDALLKALRAMIMAWKKIDEVLRIEDDPERIPAEGSPMDLTFKAFALVEANLEPSLVSDDEG